MKNLLCALALTLAASCSLLGTSTGYNRDNIRDSIEVTVNRHDAYVEADPKLSLSEKVAYEHESFVVLSLLQFDPVPAAELNAALPPVLDRTDAYISADTTLTAPEQVQRLRTSELLRKLIEPKN